MNRSRPARQLLMLCFSVAAAGVFAQAQPSKEEFKPYVGLPGKDVIWLPAELVMVEKMLDIAKVTPKDVVMDLGSGDGRTVIAAAKRGARGIGVEYNPDLVGLSRQLAAREGVADRAVFVREDLFETDLSKATVITLFLLPSINMKLRPKILDLKPGTRIVSNTFTMEEWKEDDIIRDREGEACGFNCIAYLWIVPAKVGGTWRLPQGELTLKQEFQMISGTLNSGGRSTPVSGKLRGDQINFTAGGASYTGQVSGGLIEGTVASGGTSSKWSATRAGSS